MSFGLFVLINLLIVCEIHCKTIISRSESVRPFAAGNCLQCNTRDDDSRTCLDGDISFSKGPCDTEEEPNLCAMWIGRFDYLFQKYIKQIKSSLVKSKMKLFLNKKKI